MTAPTATHLDAVRQIVDELPRLVTVPEVARVCRVHPRTVHRWLADGRLRGIRITPSGTGRVLIPRDAIADLLGEALDAA